jgi:transposase
MRSKVEPMKEVAAMVRRHLEGIVAWAQTRQTNGFLEALSCDALTPSPYGQL